MKSLRGAECLKYSTESKQVSSWTITDLLIWSKPLPFTLSACVELGYLSIPPSPPAPSWCSITEHKCCSHLVVKLHASSQVSAIYRSSCSFPQLSFFKIWSYCFDHKSSCPISVAPAPYRATIFISFLFILPVFVHAKQMQVNISCSEGSYLSTPFSNLFGVVCFHLTISPGDHSMFSTWKTSHVLLHSYLVWLCRN